MMTIILNGVGDKNDEHDDDFDDDGDVNVFTLVESRAFEIKSHFILKQFPSLSPTLASSQAFEKKKLLKDSTHLSLQWISSSVVDYLSICVSARTC